MVFAYVLVQGWTIDFYVHGFFNQHLDEARSVGLAKACVLQKIYSVPEKISYNHIQYCIIPLTVLINILLNSHSSNGWLRLNQHYYCHIENNIDVAESSLAATEYIFVHQCPLS